MKYILSSIILCVVCLACFTSCYKKYDESMTYATYSPLPTQLPNMNIEWATNRHLDDLGIVEATIQNDLQENVLSINNGPAAGKIVVSVQEISDSLGLSGVLWGLIDMYVHTIMGIPFCARHVHVRATFDIWDQNNIIAHYSYRGYQKRLIGLYYSKDSQTAIVEATRDVLSDLHRDLNKDFRTLIAQISPTSTKTPEVIEPEPEEKPARVIPDIDTNIPTTETNNANTFVVIYANENYKRVSDVPYALHDGKIFEEYCQKTLGIPQKNIRMVENATLNDMRNEILWLSRICDAFDGDAKIIIYYAGHGFPDESNKTAYLLPVDGSATEVSTGYKLDDLYATLGNMPASQIAVFIDACFSGSKREEGMLASARGVALKAKSGVPQGNMVVLSAAQGDETAYPLVDQQHGLFTYYLLKKLQTSKGAASLQELGEYVKTNVKQQSLLNNSKMQTPCMTPSASLNQDWEKWTLK